MCSTLANVWSCVPPDDHRPAFPPDEEEEEEDEDVRKLKVCIELKGLRLSKPNALGAASPDRPDIKQERAWPQPHPHPRMSGQAPSPWERRARPGGPEDKAAAAAAAQRAEFHRKWGCERSSYGKGERERKCPPPDSLLKRLQGRRGLFEDPLFVMPSFLFLVFCICLGGSQRDADES